MRVREAARRREFAVLVASPLRRSGGPHGQRCDAAGKDPAAPDAVSERCDEAGEDPAAPCDHRWWH